MNSPYKLDLGNESEPSYGSSYGHWPPYEPQKKSRGALKIIAITPLVIRLFAASLYGFLA
jgi:hypothetical protein